MSKKTTEEKTINKDISQDAPFNELRLKRNAGELTPEVIQMCSDNFDKMVAAAIACNTKRNFDGLVNELRSKPELLANVCKFVDDYIEVVHWNKLIEKGDLTFEMTQAHREADYALLHQGILDKLSKNSRGAICCVMLSYAYANT